MANIRFIEHDGTEHVVDIVPGQSLMQVAVDNNVPGIDADCGGDCACGTCHVMVEKSFAQKLQAATDDEEQMLGLNPEKSATSRLSCQIAVNESMHGMVVHLPEFQM